MTKKVAEIVVEVLQAAGVRNCYGIVGDTLNTFAVALSKSDIAWVHMRHEEAGAFAAQGEALQTERLTAVAGSCGPGSLHFINGLYEANRNRAPVILIASQIPRAEIGFDFIQEVDFKRIYENCSVYCDMILTPDQARRKAVIACQTAIAKQGVAVLILPVDVADADAVSEPSYAIHQNKPVVRPNETDLDHIARLLATGNRVAIYAGSGCRHAHDEIVALAEKLKAPVAHTSRGKDSIEYDNPYCIGMTGIIGGAAGYSALLDCDTLLMLGADFAWRQFYPERANIIQVDIDPTHIGRRHPVALGVVGDIKDTVAALLPRIAEKSDSSFLSKYVSQHRRAHEKLSEHMSPGGKGKISGIYLTSIIDRLADQDTLFASDDGTSTVWLHRHVRANGKRRMQASLLHGTMGGGVATALGLKKSHPGRQVIALVGDGGLTMMLGDLLTTIQENLPVKICVYDNAKLGFVEIEQKTEGLLPTFTENKNPDFGAVAQAMGLWGKTLSNPDETEEVVAEWLAQPGPALLNVHVAPLELVIPPFTALKPAYGMAMYSLKAVMHGKGGDVFEMVSENFL
jgi:pyruvate dehydrogenase (quinone)